MVDRKCELWDVIFSLLTSTGGIDEQKRALKIMIVKYIPSHNLPI